MKLPKLSTGFLAVAVLAVSLSVSAQAFAGEKTDKWRRAGPYYALTVSFAETKAFASLTGLVLNKADKNLEMYWAIVSVREGRAVIGFKTHKTCISNEEITPPPIKHIWIHGQKIEAFYRCAPTPDEEGTDEHFTIVSPEGNDFAVKAFAENEEVIVRLSALPIPFDTRGFSEAYAEITQKAL